MMLIRNNSVLSTPVATTAEGTMVPFDTVVYNTNSNTKLSSNTVQILTPGYYSHTCEVTISNSSTQNPATIVLQAYANGSAIPGAFTSVTVGTSGSESVLLPWITNVISAASGTANISWMISGGVVNITNAIATICRHT